MITLSTETYTVIVHQAEEGGYWGEVLQLPGCVSQGETLEEFRENIRESIEAVLESTAEGGPWIELMTEPTLAQKDSVMLFSREPETWTAAH